MAAEVLVDLKPNRLLLDPHFDSYKLSLESIPTYKVNLDKKLDEAKLSDAQYSYQHVKSFGVHNHLFLDPHCNNTVFFIDENWKICKVTIVLDTHLDPPISVFQIPEASNLRLTPERLNVTLSFPDPHWAMVSDGVGTLYVINTGDRFQDSDWKVEFHGRVLEDGQHFTIQHAVAVTSETASPTFHVLLLHIKANEDESPGVPPFITVLDWLTLTKGEQSAWAVSRVRRLESFSSPDYAVLDLSGDTLYVGADKKFKFVYDSVTPVEEPEPAASAREPEEKLPLYTWMQAGEDVVVTFILPEGVGKADIFFKLTGDHIELAVKNGPSLLKGDLTSYVDVEASNWQIKDRMLELTLTREGSEPWMEVVVGDTRGELVHTEAQAALIHERLAHLTSEQWNGDPSDGTQPAYNSQQLEDCDLMSSDSAVMQRFDGNTHLCTHKINLSSHQWLFNANLGTTRPPAICLRHDVDGLLWQPHNYVTNENVWEHIGTFNAYGYVQASKRQKKFTVCPPDMSYVALAECVRHIYIYRQPSPINSSLRNRKTGREVSAVSKQQVVALESVDHVMGIQATNDRLFVIAGNELYAIRLVSEEES